MLKDHGLDPGHTSPGHMDAETSDRKPLPDMGRDDTSDRDSAADWPESHLVEDGTGDFQVYGPTSAFRHLSISQHTRTSPMEGSSMPGFRRYLPKDVNLTEEEHELALDRFFRYYAAWGELSSSLYGTPLICFRRTNASRSIPSGYAPRALHLARSQNAALLADVTLRHPRHRPLLLRQPRALPKRHQESIRRRGETVCGSGSNKSDCGDGAGAASLGELL